VSDYQNWEEILTDASRVVVIKRYDEKPQDIYSFATFGTWPFATEEIEGEDEPWEIEDYHRGDFLKWPFHFVKELKEHGFELMDELEPDFFHFVMYNLLPIEWHGWDGARERIQVFVKK
jgi:hypothetical protein